MRKVAGQTAYLSSNRAIKDIDEVKNQFWKQVLETWATYNKPSGVQDFMKHPIFNNEYLIYHNEPVHNEMCITNNIIFVNDLYNDNDFISLEEFTRKTEMYLARQIDYNLLNSL